MSTFLFASLESRLGSMRAMREKFTKSREASYAFPLARGYYLRRLDRDHTALDVGRAVNPDTHFGLRACATINREIVTGLDYAPSVGYLAQEIDALTDALAELRLAKSHGAEALAEAAQAFEAAEAQAKAEARGALARAMLAKNAEQLHPAPRAPDMPRGRGRPRLPLEARLMSASVRLDLAGRKAVRDPAALPVLRELLPLMLDPAALADLRAWIASRMAAQAAPDAAPEPDLW